MKKRMMSLFLALIMLIQIIVPQNIFAEEEKNLPQDKYTTVGKIDFKSFDTKTMIEMNKVAAKNRKTKSKDKGSTLFSPGPYFGEDNEPTDENKLKYYGNVKAKLTVKGLNDGEFQWNEIFGVDEDGNPNPAQLVFTQINDETGVETGVERYLKITEEGIYAWTDGDGNPAELPLFNNKFEPFFYEVRIDEDVAEKVQLLTATLFGSEDASPTFEKPDAEGRIKFNLTLDLTLQQVTSTKFTSKWNTGLGEDDRPQIQADATFSGVYMGQLKSKNLTIDLPKNDTDEVIVRDLYDSGDKKLVITERLSNKPTIEIKTDTSDFTFEEADGVKTVKSDDHKFKYDFTYDVIDGGKLTMTEIIPVTFDANGGKFDSLESTAEQKIVKEVDYDGALTEKAETPTKPGKAFKGWATDKSGTTPAAETEYKNLTTAKTFYAIWSDEDIQVDQLEVAESKITFRKNGTQNVTNDFVPTFEDLKAQVKIKDTNGNFGPLPDTGVTFSIVDDEGKEYTEDSVDLKKFIYEKIKENNKDELSRTEKVKAKIKYSDGTIREIDIPIKVLKNIYKGSDQGGKYPHIPENYVRVTIDPTEKAQNPDKTYYYVNPQAKVDVPVKDPVGSGDNKFSKWTMKADSATGDGADYTTTGRHQFTEDSTITAQYGTGIVKIVYVDQDGNKIDAKYQIAGQDYPSEKSGGLGKEANDRDFETTGPDFKGYIYSSRGDIKGKHYKDPANPDNLDVVKYSYFKKVTTEEPTNKNVYFPVIFDANEGEFEAAPKDKKTVYVYFDGNNATVEKVTFKEVLDEFDKAYSNPTKDGFDFKEWQNAKTNGTKPVDDYEIQFKGWDWDADPDNGYVPETFYAHYEQASAFVKYLDLDGKAIGDEFKFISTEDGKDVDGEGNKLTLDKKYPTEKEGTLDEKIASDVFTAKTAPTLIGYKFNRIELNPANAKYAMDNKATIKIYYEKLPDVVLDPTPDDDTDKPEGYVTVTFKAGINGKIDGNTKDVVYYVNPKVDPVKVMENITPPTITANQGYKVGSPNWKDAENKALDNKTQITKDLTYTAQYEKEEDIIPGTGNEKPDGFVTVRFLTNKNGKLTGETIYYVNPNASKKLSEINAPKITANDGYKVANPNWKPDLAADTEAITEDKIFVANYDSLGKAEITYISMDVNMGTVSPDSEELKDGADVVGSTATAKEGYKFVKWINTKGEKVSTDAKFVPTKKESATYIAVFENGTIADKVNKSYNLEGIDLAVFVGDKLGDTFWKDGVSEKLKTPNNLTEDEKAELEKALEDATVSDKSERNSDHEVLSPSKGTLEIRFTDGSTLTVNQKLYVYANGSQVPEDKDQPTPKDKVLVTYKAGEGVENFVDKTVLVKKGTKEADLLGKPDAKAKKGYKDLKWTANPTIDKTNGIQENTTVTASAVVDNDFAKIDFTVNKDWQDTVKDMPTMNFTLYRKIEGGEEKVDGAEVKEITQETTSATWTELPKTDSNGNEYKYFVKETFKDTSDVRNANWILGEMITDANGNTITNKLKTVPGQGEDPKPEEHRMGKLTITKKIESKPVTSAMSMAKAPAAPLEFTFKLIDPYGDVVKVDGKDTFTLKAGETKEFENLFYGDYTVEEIDAKGLTPFVKVGESAETKSSTAKVTLTMKSKEGTVLFTNKNVIPDPNPNIIEVKATKIWVNGPSKDHTAVDLKLYRQAEGGQKEEVTDVTPVKTGDINNSSKFNYAWEDLPKINDDGKEYTYTVEEANVTDNKVTVNGNTYTVKQEGNTITNTYVVPKTDDLIATKKWVGVPAGTKTPEVKFQLQRTVNGVTEDVGQAMALTNNQANFGKQDKTDANGVEYIYTVKELDAQGNVFNDANYTSEVEGLIVTNTYHAPEVKYTVTYRPGSQTATGTMNSVTVAENTNYTVLANGFINPGYTFKGWKVDNGPEIIQPGNAITVNANVTLTAQWEKTTTPEPGGSLQPLRPSGTVTVIEKEIVEVPVKDRNLRKEVWYMQGFADYFRPTEGLTRAEAAQILANALVEDGYKFNPNYALSYKDITGNEWYAKAIRITTQADVFRGYDTGYFDPHKKITRGEWIATLRRFQELDTVDGNHMGVRTNHWGIGEIEAAYKAGWLTLYDQGLAKFKVDEFIPRQEVAAVSNKAFNRVLDKTYIQRNSKNLISYKDVNPSMWSYEDILCASNTFIHRDRLYRGHALDRTKKTYNIDLAGYIVTQDKFQRIERR